MYRAGPGMFRHARFVMKADFLENAQDRSEITDGFTKYRAQQRQTTQRYPVSDEPHHCQSS
jgi:hypothetical protein